MKIPPLETKRLKLVPPSIESYDVYAKFYLDAEASRSYNGPLSEEQIWARLKADLGSWYLLGLGVWVIRSKEGNEDIGVCGFWKGKDWPKELTWWVLPEFRGKGYATEASKAAISHAYDDLGWSEVETYMNDDNVEARSLVLKLGGIKQRRTQFPDGLERDIYILPADS